MKIRFVDDNGYEYPDWKEKKLSEVAELYQPQTISGKDLTTQGYPVYGANGQIGYYDKYNHDTEQVTVTCRGNTCGTLNYTKPFSWITGNAMVINPFEGQATKRFLYFCMESINFNYIITGSGQPQITRGPLASVAIALPSLAEQEKIAAFFGALDERIAVTADKVKLLKEQKAGYLQKIFAQELVFTDDNGQSYPEWEQKKLGTLGTWGKNYSYSRAFQGEGTLCHIHYGDIHSVYSGVARTSSLPSITVESTNHELANDGDVIFADASEDVKDLGKSVVLKNDATKPFISGLHTHRFVSDSGSLNPYFLMYFTQTAEYHDFMRKYGTGVSVLGISKTNLNLLPLLLPSLPEQEKIAEFFSALDEQIELTENKLTLLKEQKKGYLQGIFG